MVPLEPNWDAAKVVLDAGQWLFTLAIGAYAWWVNRSRANRQELAQISNRINDNVRRIDAVEREVHSAPGHKDVQALRDDLSSMRAELKELTGTMRGMNRAVDLMTEHLMNRRRNE